jgi:hypothetical protein
LLAREGALLDAAVLCLPAIGTDDTIGDLAALSEDSPEPPCRVRMPGSPVLPLDPI